MEKLQEAYKLLKECEKKYENDWNGGFIKRARQALEEALDEYQTEAAHNLADAAIDATAILDEVKKR